MNMHVLPFISPSPNACCCPAPGDDEYDDDEDLDEEEGGMLEEEDIGEENQDPKGPSAPSGMMLQGKAGFEAAVADAGAGVEDMEL